MAKRWISKLYVQVLIGVSIGVLLGVLWPEVGADMKPLGDAFIKLIKMVLHRSSLQPWFSASPKWKT